MTLDERIQYVHTQRFLEEEGLVEDLSMDQYDEDPFEVLSSSEGYNQNNFRPSTVADIEQALDGEYFDTKSVEVINKRHTTGVMGYLGSMFDEVSRWSPSSDTWIVNQDIDFEQLEKLSKISFAASEISRLYASRNYPAQIYEGAEFNEEEHEIRKQVLQQAREFFERIDYRPSDR